MERYRGKGHEGNWSHIYVDLRRDENRLVFQVTVNFELVNVDGV